MKQNPLLLFIIKAVALYIVWFISYDFFIEPSGKVDSYLNKVVGDQSAAVLRLIGYNSDTVPGINQTIVRIDAVNMVGVGDPCNGLELFVLFAGFILCFPGKTKARLWFIPAGLVVIHFANILRSSSLALIQLHSPESLDFNHHYTFTIIVYAIIFGIWMIWVNKYSGLFDKKVQDPGKQVSA